VAAVFVVVAAVDMKHVLEMVAAEVRAAGAGAHKPTRRKDRAGVECHGRASLAQRFSTICRITRTPIAPAMLNAPAAKTFAPVCVS
jgi:hypothetical protein